MPVFEADERKKTVKKPTVSAYEAVYAGAAGAHRSGSGCVALGLQPVIEVRIEREDPPSIGRCVFCWRRLDEP